MQINIQTIHFDADQKLLDFTEKKVSKLETVFDRITVIDVFLKFESASSVIKEKTAELKVLIPGNTLFAKENSDNFEEAIDAAVESMKRQLQKQKEKFKN